MNGNQKETNNKNLKVNTASINKLSGMIRNLNKQQLKGIILILWDKNEKIHQNFLNLIWINYLIINLKNWKLM